MDDRLLWIFQAELKTQCEFVVIGAQIANANLTGERPHTRAIWFGLQGVLISASNASKLLWGTGRTDKEVEQRAEERRPLRESVQVDDSSPLKSRRIRNSFEHFDERLMAWFGERGEKNPYLGRNISEPGGIVVGAEPTPDHFGHFDPSTCVLTFWEESVELNPLVAEAERILDCLQHLRGRPVAPDA